MSVNKEIMAALAGQAEGLSEAELLKVLGLPKHLKRKVLGDLEELIETGKVVKNARHRYRAAAFSPATGGKAGKGAALVEGVFQLTNSGHAFAKRADGVEYYLPERFRGWALPGDTVELRPLPPQAGVRRGDDTRKPGAEVVRVIKRGREQWVGRLRRDGKEVFADVRLGDMELELEAVGVPTKVPDGDWVVLGAPGLDVGGKEPEASRFISHLGGEDTAHLDTLILIKKAGLKEEFDAATLDEAGGFKPTVEADALAGRMDLRKLITFTIDGADAKDFDDAVSLERNGTGWRLGVHIADVAHYVKPGRPLDKEAYERGTSVYLPDRVLPMLPEALSNGLCSLKPDVDRLTMSAIIELDERGKMLSSSFANSVIHSARRFTYEEIEAWFNGQGELRPGEDKTLGRVLQDMRQLAKLRHKIRDERGGLDFDFPETKVTLDAKGLPIDLFRRARLFTHQLIEEFMLLANEAVAKELNKTGYPALYRIHEEPDPDKMDETLAYLGKLKIGGPKGGSVTPKDLQRLLAKVAGKPEQRLVQTLVLRSLRLARYSPGHDMHFGLALEDYCHFTSPIRRYPDLVIHRMLKARVGGQTVAAAKSLAGNLELVGVQTSTMERKAEACERECIRAKQVRYLEARLGQTFPATVTSVTHFGFFCEIDPFPAEGLVPLGSLKDDFYDFDAANYCLVGARKKRKINIGDKLWVKVMRTDWESLKVDFEASWEAPVEAAPAPKA